MRGEEIAFFGAWTVTDFGLECTAQNYEISAEMLAAQGQTWLKHMAQKNWVDMCDFADAFHVACEHHGIQVEYFGARTATPQEAA